MRNIHIVSFVALCLLFGGCTNQQDENTIATLHKQISATKAENGKLKAKNGKLEAQLNQLTAEVTQLSDTPSARLQAIRNFVAKNDLQGARASLVKMRSKYPKADQTLTASHIVQKLSEQIKADQRKLARLKKLKFRAISTAPTFTHNGLKFRALRVSRTRRWISDSYNGEYHYSEADRATRFIVLRVNISSKASKNPELFPVAVYKVSGEKLEHIANFSYAFRRWHDYGSYLGNYSDYGNSFAKSNTVRFTLAAQVSDADLKVPLMVIASNEQCVERINRDLPPAVAYFDLSCKSLKQELSLSDVAGKSFHVIKRYNF
jgi:hypothetical protein